jgi:hypothetical protein
VQRSSAGNLKAQERRHECQALAKEPTPDEDTSQIQELTPPPEAASVSKSPLVSTEAPQKLKCKRINTTKVSKLIALCLTLSNYSSGSVKTLGMGGTPGFMPG